MNLDAWAEFINGAKLDPDERIIANNIIENQRLIDAPRSVAPHLVERVLDIAVIVLATDWSKHRDDLKNYNENVFPYLKARGCVDNVPAPAEHIRDIVGARESSGDTVRALKDVTKMWVGKPCNELVASVLNAAFVPDADDLWTYDKVSRL